MNKSSIFFSITFVFIISISSIIAAFIFLMDYDQKNYTEKLNNKYTIVARATLFHLNHFISEKQLENQVKSYHMNEIKDKKIQREIIERAKVLQRITGKIGSTAIMV